MKTSLPFVFAAGIFDSRTKFRQIAVSKERTVDCYEIEYFTESGGTSHINGVSHPIEQGNLLIARPGDRRHSTLPFRCRYVHIENADGAVAEMLEALPTFSSFPPSEHLEERFDEIAVDWTSSTPYRNNVTAAKLILLLERLHALTAAKESKRSGSVVEVAERMIHTHYDERLSVERLAEYCNVSASYLYCAFRQERGISPHGEILQIRVEQAKKLLCETVEPIENIAKRCGFRSASYFSDCFRRTVGVSPIQFRQQSR